ncbi:uncharacterized protein LOC111518742 [Drosophila willistoni]|uniref:uncharacterized protein LOC111518742 n=1 Tax=Drosophila willistoni TaxID=7260 RepID=UPI001F073E93|nr:uncharacterized protein LOC111518742 [Drosophila willistoni]
MSERMDSFTVDSVNMSFKRWSLSYFFREEMTEYSLRRTWRDVVGECETDRKNLIESTRFSITLVRSCVHKDVSLVQQNYQAHLTKKVVGKILKLVSDEYGQLVFLLKLEGVDQPQAIPTKVANATMPHLVEEFYRNRRSQHDFIATLLKETW